MLVFRFCLITATLLELSTGEGRLAMSNVSHSGQIVSISANLEAVGISSSFCNDVKLPNDNLLCDSPWQYCDNGSCHYGNQAPHAILQYNTDGNLSILSCYCMTYSEKEGVTELGNCVYNCGNPHHDISQVDQYYSLPKKLTELNHYVCNETFNRKGTLCGECIDGYHPRSYSFEVGCIECPHGGANWWKLLLIAFLPLTVFCLFVLLFKINVTSSHLHGFIIYCQVAYAPSESQSTETALRFVGAMYGIWNLDFFRSMQLNICLNTDTVQTLALDLAVGVYPQLLVVLTYLLIYLYDCNCVPLVILWKPFGKVFGLFLSNWSIKTSLIDAFATFFFLSNFKLLSASIDILVPVKVYQLMPSGELSYSWRVFYEASIPYFGARHLPYAILALLALVLFDLLPVLLLILYPFALFQKFLNLFPCRWYILHTFVDSFHGCYKDGTEPGTRDCRWFASMIFIMRYILILIGSFTLTAAFFPLATLILVLLCLILIVIQPFKDSMHHIASINSFFILLLACLYANLTGIIVSDASTYSKYISKMMYGLAVIITVIPLLYVSVLSLLWMYKHRRFGIDWLKHLHVWKQGYQILEY